MRRLAMGVALLIFGLYGAKTLHRRQVLGPDVTVERTDHILAGARRCAYRITAR